MMTIIFAAMLAALVCAHFGPGRLAVAALLVCLTLSAGLFLFEIYNPDYGFRMPWLQGELHLTPHDASHDNAAPAGVIA